MSPVAAVRQFATSGPMGEAKTRGEALKLRRGKSARIDQRRVKVVMG